MKTNIKINKRVRLDSTDILDEGVVVGFTSSHIKVQWDSTGEVTSHLPRDLVKVSAR